MVHQAEVNTNGKAKAADPNVAASFTSLAHDAIELAELQAKLLKLDAQAAARNGGMSIALLVVGVCLLLGCVPVALVALAEVFVAQFAWSRAAAFAASAAIGLVLSAGTGAAAWFRVKSALAVAPAFARRAQPQHRLDQKQFETRQAGPQPAGPAPRSFSEH